MEGASFADYVVEQLVSAGAVRSRAMFGGHAVYCDDRVIGLICDDQFFVKPTDEGRAFIGEPRMAPPYEGAKDYFLVQDRIEDADWLGELVRITAGAVPPPKKKGGKKG